MHRVCTTCSCNKRTRGPEHPQSRAARRKETDSTLENFVHRRWLSETIFTSRAVCGRQIFQSSASIWKKMSGPEPPGQPPISAEEVRLFDVEKDDIQFANNLLVLDPRLTDWRTSLVLRRSSPRQIIDYEAGKKYALKNSSLVPSTTFLGWGKGLRSRQILSLQAGLLCRLKGLLCAVPDPFSLGRNIVSGGDDWACSTLHTGSYGMHGNAASSGVPLNFTRSSRVR